MNWWQRTWHRVVRRPIRHLFHPDERRVAGCGHGSSCMGRRERHRQCYECGTLTCRRTMVVNEVSLRRQYIYTCEACQERLWRSREQDRLKTERVRKDWDEITVPINGHSIDTTVMDEQYVGAAREAIRAFASSGAPFATVADVSSNTLQQSIATLGLGEEMYAEERNGTTVIRRVEESPLATVKKARR